MRHILLLFTAAAVAGCGSPDTLENILDERKVDYERTEYQERRDLKYPPDIISARRQSESQLLSEYRITAVPEINTPDEVALSGERRVSYRREGNLRWIDFELSSADTWNLTHAFWKDLNFSMEKEDAEIGTLETEWLDLRQGTISAGLGAYLDTFIGRVRDSGERDKFITRVEPNGDISSVYVAHRRISAQFDREGLFSGYSPLPSDHQLETEILRRMMIYAARTPEAEQETAFADDINEEETRADGDYDLQETRLLINKPAKESWLLVRIGLDRGGFTIEDQDHTERAYYIRHNGGPESQQIFGKAETNFFNKLFGEEQPILREIKLFLTEEGETTVVNVVAADDGDELTEAQQSVLLELLSINLP